VQQKSALRQFVANECEDADDLNEIKQDIAIEQNKIMLAPSFPYVTDKEGKNVRIPESLYEEVIDLIMSRAGSLDYV
jgi:hypothetical protein